MLSQLKNKVLRNHQTLITLIAAFAFLMPFSRVINVSVVILVLLTILSLGNASNYKKFKLLGSTNGLLSLIVFFGILTISLVYTEQLNKGIDLLVRSLPILLIPLSFLFINELKLSNIKKIFNYYILGCIAALCYCLIHALFFNTNLLALKEGFSYFTAPLDFHPSYFSVYLIFAFSIFISIYSKKLKDKKWLLFLTWLVVLLIILFLKSRAPFIIFLCISLLMIFKNIRKEIAFGISLVLLIIVLFYYQDIIELISYARSSKLSVEERFDIWKSALKVIKENIAFGVGIGDYQIALDKEYFISGFDKGVDHKFNCHNQYLQTFISSGIVALLSLLSIFYFIFKKGLVLNNHLPFYFLICVCILMTFDAVLVLQHGVYFFSFFAALLLKINKNNLDELV